MKTSISMLLGCSLTALAAGPFVVELRGQAVDGIGDEEHLTVHVAGLVVVDRDPYGARRVPQRTRTDRDCVARCDDRLLAALRSSRW